jgi:Xaa-Pro aminopeptidase
MASAEILSVSAEECESRVEKVRDFVCEHDLGALLVYSGPKAHMWYQTGHVAYLTNWNNLDFFTDTIVVVPETGEAALLCPGLEYSMEMISRVSWMRDIRLVASPDPKSISTTFDEGMVGAESDMAGAGFGLEIKRVLNERGIGDKAIGVIGVENMPVPVHRELVAHLGERLTETEDIVARLRYIKSDGEIRIIRDTVALSDAVFGTVAEVLKPGMMGYELSADLEHYAKANGADFASYTLTSGPAENIEQGRLDVGRHLRKLEWGDQIQINTYLVKNGYFVQPVRSGTVGPPSQQMRDLMGASNEIQDDIIAAMKPGAAIADVCKAARDSAARLGCEGEWGRFGHGQGLDYGEWPYFQDTNTTPIEPGVVAVIHPPLFVPGSNNKFLYCGLGDVVLVTDTGAERLNQFPREPFHVGL